MSSQKQKNSNITPEKLALFDKLIATHPKTERKDANNLYTSLNGHMFTYLDPSRRCWQFVCLRGLVRSF